MKFLDTTLGLRNRRSFVFAMVFATSCLTSTPRSFAQKVVVVDAGAGMKQEMVYDASGKVVEVRTLGPDGKLQVRNTFDFEPGFHTAKSHTTTNYFPNGSVAMSLVENTDENANFLGDVLAVYDQAGKQTAGHRMTHDPFTGVYRCWNWDVTSQKYISIECPAAEEESSEPEPLKPLTQDEAVKQLVSARQTAHAQEKAARMAQKSPVRPEEANTNVEVGIVWPAQITAGERVSGSITAEPEKYEDLPGLDVVRLLLPAGSERNKLSTWNVIVFGEPPQLANLPFTLTVPSNTSDLKITLQQGDPAQAISRLIKLSITPSKLKTPTTYQAPAICTKSDVCTISGKFGGDARNTFAAFGKEPAAVVAETPRAAYIAVPDAAPPIPQYLIVNEQAKLLAFPTAVAELELRADKWQVKAGENLLIHVTLKGPGDIADNQWHAGIYPDSSLERARAFVPSFQLKKATRDDQEEERQKRERNSKQKEGKEGVVLLAIRNQTPEIVSFRSSTNGSYAFSLTPESFKMGPFQYHIVVVPIKDGTFSARSAVIPFLAPVSAQEFQLPPEQAAKSPMP